MNKTFILFDSIPIANPNKSIEKKLKRPYLNFESALRNVAKRAKKGPISIRKLLSILEGKGKLLLLISLAMSLCQKIPFTGLFFGPLIAYLGLRLAAKSRPIPVPEEILHKQIPSKIVIKGVNPILRFLNWLKQWSYPRHFWSHRQGSIRLVDGLMISLIGIAIAISPPIPFCGLIAFAAIFSLVIGLLNDDDLYTIVGYALAFLYFIVAILLLKFLSIGKIIHLIRSLFS